MKKLITICMMLTLITLSGCMNTSKQGGIAPTNEQFSITVPSSITLIQGATQAVTVSFDRGSDFKQDVMLNIKANDISVTPTSVLLKAGDKPEVQIQVTAVKDAALGNYMLSVRAIPAFGNPTSAVCTITVVAP